MRPAFLLMAGEAFDDVDSHVNQASFSGAFP